MRGGWFGAGGGSSIARWRPYKGGGPFKAGRRDPVSCFVGHAILVQWQPLYLASYLALLAQIYLTAI